MGARNSPVSAWLAVGIVFGLGLLLGTNVSGLTVSKGEKALPIEARDADGKPLSLKQYSGKLVLLNFWATWCPHCRAEVPPMKQVYDKYHKEGFEVIGISTDEDRQDVIDFIKKHQIPWRQVLDTVSHGGKFGHRYGVVGLPTAILVGPDGTIIDTLARGSRLEKLVAKHIGSVTNKEPIKIPDVPTEKASER